MALTIVNKTPVSPTSESSEGYVAFKELGPRPICGSCGGEDDCVECGGDRPYLQPVVAGDLVYLQFRFADNFNNDPESPDFGWKDGTDEFWIEAKLLFPSGASLALNQQSIIAAKQVGYFNGAYQNLILNSQKIEDYIDSVPLPDDCFSVEIKTYRIQLPEYTTVRNFSLVLPSWESPTQYNGVFWALEGVIYEGVNGAWVATELNGDLIFSTTQAGFYEFGADEYFPIAKPSGEKVEDVICNTGWFKFVDCESTVKIEGLHGESDCNGNYYGGEVRFRDRYRLFASFEHVGYVTEKEENDNGIITNFDNKESWLLRLTKGVPNSVAKRINNTLLGSQVFIDNNEYKNFTDLERNNETGLTWWSQLTCQRDNCSKSQGCEEAIFTNPIVICDEPNCPEVGEPVSLIGELGDFSATVPCGDTYVVPAAEVRDTEGNVLGQVDAGETLVVDCSGGDPSGSCEDAIVQNSDASFEQAIGSGDTYVLEDYTFNLNIDGVQVATATAPAMTDVILNVNWI